MFSAPTLLPALQGRASTAARQAPWKGVQDNNPAAHIHNTPAPAALFRNPLARSARAR